MYIYTVVA